MTEKRRSWSGGRLQRFCTNTKNTYWNFMDTFTLLYFSWQWQNRRVITETNNKSISSFSWEDSIFWLVFIMPEIPLCNFLQQLHHTADTSAPDYEPDYPISLIAATRHLIMASEWRAEFGHIDLSTSNYPVCRWQQSNLYWGIIPLHSSTKCCQTNHF